jgi:hypothetical protein
MMSWSITIIYKLNLINKKNYFDNRRSLETKYRESNGRNNFPNEIESGFMEHDGDNQYEYLYSNCLIIH